MHDNTPPRIPEFEDIAISDEEIVEEEEDEDLDDMEEVTLAELEELLAQEIENEEAELLLQSTEPIHDDSYLTYEKHDGPVFTCSMQPNGPIVATGGEDDCAYIWNIETLETIFKITHNDTVTDVHFNHDGTLLASGDMGGDIYVHKFQALCGVEQWRKVWSFQMGDMTWMKWHSASNILIAGSETGEVYIWRIPSGVCKILPGDGKRCEAGEITFDGKMLFTSYTNGALKLWDMKSAAMVMEAKDDETGAGNSVTCVACEKDSPFYMAGDQEGKVIFCINTGPINSVQARGAVECVAFSPCNEMKLAATGTLDGEVAIWDYSKYVLRSKFDLLNPEDGIARLKWIDKNTVLVSTIHGRIIGIDVRTGADKFTLTGHKGDVYDFHFNPNMGILVTVSEDHKSKIFKLPEMID